MSDIVDHANDMAEHILSAQRSVRKHSKLVPVGCCHYCNEILPRVGQLFCNGECREDYEYEDQRRKALGMTE